MNANDRVEGAVPGRADIDRILHGSRLHDQAVRDWPAVLRLDGRGKSMERFAVDGDGEHGRTAIAKHLGDVGETHIEVQRSDSPNLQAELRMQSSESPFLSGIGGKHVAQNVLV